MTLEVAFKSLYSLLGKVFHRLLLIIGAVHALEHLGCRTRDLRTRHGHAYKQSVRTCLLLVLPEASTEVICIFLGHCFVVAFWSFCFLKVFVQAPAIR